MKTSTLEICNKLIDVEDMERPEWRNIIGEMHRLMRVSKEKQTSFLHCTDRKSLFHRAEIETYKHWEYPWAILWGSFESGMSVLDCGCGRGFLQLYLARIGCNVTSVDISTMKTKMLRKFWRLASKLHVKEDKSSVMRKLAKRYKTELDFYKANISELPFDTETFDRVYCISVLEHMNVGEDEEAVREMSRVLKPGGRLLLTVDFSPEPIPRRSYNEQNIHKLIKISGLKLLGECDYSVDNWNDHLNDLKRCFDKSDVELSSAGFVLVKE